MNDRRRGRSDLGLTAPSSTLALRRSASVIVNVSLPTSPYSEHAVDQVSHITLTERDHPRPLHPNEVPDFNPLAYTLDLLLPIINLGQKNAWNPVRAGQVIAYALIFAGWLLATAVLAGISRVPTRN